MDNVSLVTIINNTVVHHGKPARAVRVGMGVDLVRFSMSGPARMPDARLAANWLERLRQGLYPQGIVGGILHGPPAHPAEIEHHQHQYCFQD